MNSSGVVNRFDELPGEERLHVGGSPGLGRVAHKLAVDHVDGVQVAPLADLGEFHGSSLGPPIACRGRGM